MLIEISDWPDYLPIMRYSIPRRRGVKWAFNECETCWKRWNTWRNNPPRPTSFLVRCSLDDDDDDDDGYQTRLLGGRVARRDTAVVGGKWRGDEGVEVGGKGEVFMAMR